MLTVILLLSKKALYLCIHLHRMGAYILLNRQFSTIYEQCRFSAIREVPQ